MDELRDVMTAAFDAEEKRIAEGKLTDDDEIIQPTPEPEPELEPEPKSEPEAKEKPEKAAPKEPEPIETVPKGKEKQPGKADPAPAPAEPAGKPVDSKAPVSWSATARESWAKLPNEAKAEIVKREKEVNKVLQESAGARRAIQELNTVLAPHAQRLMSAGIQSPLQAIGNLLTTEGTLRTGDTMTKAKTIATLIKEYGVDIRTLDSVLSGQPQTPGAAPQTNPDIEAIINQRLAPYANFVTQQQQAAQQALMRQRQEAQSSVAEFSANAEFIQDVRLDMADILDLAAKHGRTMTIEEAYNRACSLHPEVSKILAERERQQAIMGTKATTDAKKRAAVSITGQRGGDRPKAPETLRDQIAESWAQVMDS